MFKDQNDFSMHIEKIKAERSFETYTEAVVWFYENETDHEMTEIAKMLNPKIIGAIEYESEQAGLLKTTNVRLM